MSLASLDGTAGGNNDGDGAADGAEVNANDDIKQSSSIYHCAVALENERVVCRLQD